MEARPAVERPRFDLRVTAKRIQDDPLVRNSFFLMTTTTLTAVLGFLFWLIVARLYPVSEVGRATSLLSAVALLSYFSLVGLSSSLVRHLPTAARRSEHVSSALITVAGTGLLAALIFVGIAPFSAPELAFISSSWGHAGTFVALAMFAALNLLTDSVFVALRAAKYNLLINGVLMGLVKIALPFLFVSAGAIGIFAASGIASGIAAVLSVIAIHSQLKIQIRWRFSLDVLRETFRYSLGNYLSSCLNLVPLLVIPILVLDRLGPAIAAAYFIAFQIATVINSVSYAVGEALFAEGSHEQENLRELMRRSATIMGAVITPAVLTAVLLAGPVLRIFGSTYKSTAQSTLIVLAVSSFAVAFNTWTSFLLKITRWLVVMIVSEVVFAGATTVLVVLAAPRGPAWVAAAWGCGNLICGAIAAVAIAARTKGKRFQDPAGSPRRGSGAAHTAKGTPVGRIPGERVVVEEELR
jgi:O-antigen/teichoic acid export membrane protein